HGSILASDWLPYAIVVTLIIAAVLGSRTALRPTRLGLTAFGSLVALAAWAGISAAWSPVPELARDECLLTTLYAAAFLLPQLTLDEDAQRSAALGVLVAALGSLPVPVSF